MPVQSRFITVGTQAPEFSLPSVNGESIDIKQFRGRKNIVLVFLRGFL